LGIFSDDLLSAFWRTVSGSRWCLFFFIIFLLSCLNTSQQATCSTVVYAYDHEVNIVFCGFRPTLVLLTQKECPVLDRHARTRGTNWRFIPTSASNRVRHFVLFIYTCFNASILAGYANRGINHSHLDSDTFRIALQSS
jgi:hypothetical protein